MAKEINLTIGNPFRQIIRFSLPLVGGSIFQQFYNFIDTLIIGRLLGIDALAAIGAYYPLSFLILGFVQGSCIGFSIPLAQSVGANNTHAIRQNLVGGILICTILAVILTPMMIVYTHTIMVVLSTPRAILKMATLFTIVSFVGIPGNILYNYSASVLRAFGDSTHPFYFLVASLFVNIALALTFIVVFKWGLISVAVATVISEFFAGVLNVGYYIHQKFITDQHLRSKDINLHAILHICAIGFPMGFEYSVSAIGAVVMQDAINLLGTAAVAAQSAGDKIRQLFTLPMESVGMAIATYMAQNYGARKSQRIKSGLRAGSLIQLTWSLFAFLLVMLLKKTIISLVLGTTTGHVFHLTDQYLTTISFFFIVHGLLMIFRNTLQGLGHSMYAIVSGFGELIGRSFAAWLATLSLGYVAICYANQIAWGVSLVYCLFMVWWIFIHDSKIQRRK
ncbi:MATE family efflux transporter [Secundilactobacillus folii]|uniref:Oligosaccharide flippase family protein n=1 Tax=Secundilactobacillus folii TaxID=2678357 RepID=A0A7X2XX57_9LACO|nr:MATE family efflux transporter [Secundilactobacillus folii]MTV83299.1 oligosaccharide flippase family protein [Secundilactobacillus folii]